MEVADEMGAPSMELEPILSLRLIRTSCTACADCEEAKWSRTEVSSPPHVTACAELLPNLASVPGLAMELATVDGQGAPLNYVYLRVPRKEQTSLPALGFKGKVHDF